MKTIQKINNEIEEMPPSLRTLKRLIDEELAEAKKDAENAMWPHQVRCGKYLIQAKRRCEMDGIGFLEWLASSFPYDERTAEYWMLGYRKSLKIRANTRTDRSTFEKPIIENLTKDKLEQEKENSLTRQRLVKIVEDCLALGESVLRSRIALAYQSQWAERHEQKTSFNSIKVTSVATQSGYRTINFGMVSIQKRNPTSKVPQG